MANNNDNKILNVPALRFSEFTDEWNKYSFDDIAQYKKGPFGSALKKEIFVPESNDTIKIYEQQNAIKKDWKLGRYFISRDYFINHMQQFVVKAGDIIVSCAGTIGEMYELPQNAISGVFNQALMRVRVNTDLIDKRIFIEVFSSMINSFSKIYSNGSAIKNIPPFADLKRTTVFIPMKNEQDKISKFVSLLDERIATQNKIIEKLETLIKGIVEKTFVSSQYVTLQHYSPIITSGKDQNSGGNYPLYGSTGVIGSVLNPSYNKPIVLIARVGSIGNVQYVTAPCGISDNTLIIDAGEDNRFIYYYLNGYNFSHIISGTTQPLITASSVKKIEIPVIEKHRRKKIVSTLYAIEQKLRNEKYIAYLLSRQKYFLLSQMFI